MAVERLCISNGPILRIVGTHGMIDRVIEDLQAGDTAYDVVDRADKYAANVEVMAEV